MPILFRVGLVHAQFETIHPFLDGNGRVGRLLITVLLCEREILQTPVLYISHYFKQNREEYYRRLQAIRDRGEWEAWLKFFFQGVADVSQQATGTARRIVDLRESHRRLIIQRFGRVAGNGMTVLETLYCNPIVQVNDIVRVTGVTYPAASSLMNKFVENGLLTEVTGRARNRRYRYGEYVDLFAG